MTNKSIITKIQEALTTDQVCRLLEALWDQKKVNEILPQLDKDIATTISRIINQSQTATDGHLSIRDSDSGDDDDSVSGGAGTEITAGNAQMVISNQKRVEQWLTLWHQWQIIVMELGDEMGRYATQEDSWEAPYFDSDGFSDDLDVVAGKMTPMLTKISKIDNKSRDRFKDALLEIEDGIESFPEWMDAEYSECYLGQNVTQCLLKWEKSLAESTVDFVGNIQELEQDLDIVCLDSETVIDFMLSLPEEDKNDIYKYINKNSKTTFWEIQLNSVHSAWHKIFYQLAEIFNPDFYLENTRRLLSQQWEYGPPLIKQLLEDKNLVEADKVCQETISSYLDYHNINDWDPVNNLTISSLCYGYGEADKTIVQVFNDWINITQELGLTDKLYAIKIQQVTYSDPYNWDKVLDVYLQTDRGKAVKNLLKEWYKFVITMDLQTNFRVKKPKNCWLLWLLQTKFEGKDADWFNAKTIKWVKKYRCNGYNRRLFLLTQDLFEISAANAKEKYPLLYEMVFYRNDYSCASRQTQLKEIGPEPLVDYIFKWWQDNATQFVPHPASAHKANYHTHADWLAVVHELNPIKANDLLNKWRKEHKRKKNLWKAIAEKGL